MFVKKHFDLFKGCLQYAYTGALDYGCLGGESKNILSLWYICCMFCLCCVQGFVLEMMEKWVCEFYVICVFKCLVFFEFHRVVNRYVYTCINLVGILLLAFCWMKVHMTYCIAIKISQTSQNFVLHYFLKILLINNPKLIKSF